MPLPSKIFAWPPQIFRVTSCHCIEDLHRPLTAPLVAKLAPPVAPQMKMSGSPPDFEYFNAKLFEFYVGQNSCFSGAEMFPALHVYCSSMFLDPKSSSVPRHSLSFLGFH